MKQTEGMTAKDLCQITKHQDPWMNSYVINDTREIPLKEIEDLAAKLFHKMPDKIKKEVGKNQRNGAPLEKGEDPQHGRG